uniref:Growth hormone receptor n=1 Tax=Cichlasoma dimerus TaxID=420348 RepID=B6E507_9CICH|nr:somatolactin receptor [Cichlasoma dimerus]
MALSPSANLLILLILSSLDWLPSPGSTFLTDWDHMTSPAPIEPHFSECISRDQATFRCWWSPGSFQNLSSPGALRVFYLKKDSHASQWKECPVYIHSSRECFFDENHTSIWITYCMQLRTQNNVTYFNEDDCFTVENIVRPDPPVSLNWTLLNISPSGLNYDVKVNWEPPPTADVGLGWMRVEYELQYRGRNTTNWEAMEIQRNTHQTIYGLHLGKEYEVHIRCRMQAFIKFGEFSDSIFIQVTEIPSAESAVHLTVVLVFGTVGILILFMLIVISQQNRLMIFLLPPVPAPKIKGIDSELLKKGKLDELNFMLSGGGIDCLPTYAPDFYQDEPWVELIEVDVEDEDSGGKEDNRGSDTQKLLGQPQHINIGCSNAVSGPDADSGRAGCYDTDLPEQETLMLMATLLPGQPDDKEASLDVVERSSASETGDRPLIQTQTRGPQTWVNTDFYAQVSNVMPSGGVVLSPGQQLRIQESISATEEETKKKRKGNGDSEESEERKQKELQFRLIVVDPEGNGYTTESNVQQISTPPPSSLMPGEGYHIIHPQPVEPRPTVTTEVNLSPYILPDSSQSFAPVADYTVVQELDSHHSLLLNPSTHHTPPPCLPQHPFKAPMPVGYITPDLLGNLSQ